MQYYGTRLSENISRRDPEGYLLCLNVPVARTGTQTYLPEELGIYSEKSETPQCHLERSREILPQTACNKVSLNEGAEGGVGGDRKAPQIKVFRPEEEVFSKETIASFEGMPVTNNHPPEGVDIENIRRFQMGHAHNVRRGTGPESDLLLADLIITDPRLIDAILSGKREISCGYTYELSLEGGRYIQRRIRGNHIAVVDAGRAGPRVSIRDYKTERSTNVMQKSLTRLLGRLAQDGGAERVAEFIEEVLEEQETPAEEPYRLILQKLDQLLAILNSALAPAPEAPEQAADEETENAENAEKAEKAEEAAETAAEVAEAAEAEPAAAEEIAELVESLLDPDRSDTLEDEPEEAEKPKEADPAIAADALRAALTAIRPALAAMTPRQRRKTCGQIAANLRQDRRGNDAGIYAALAASRKPAPDLNALGKRIMAQRNPNYRK